MRKRRVRTRSSGRAATKSRGRAGTRRGRMQVTTTRGETTEQRQRRGRNDDDDDEGGSDKEREGTTRLGGMRQTCELGHTRRTRFSSSNFFIPLM
jgi:hypothetical protein